MLLVDQLGRREVLQDYGRGIELEYRAGTGGARRAGQDMHEHASASVAYHLSPLYDKFGMHAVL